MNLNTFLFIGLIVFFAKTDNFFADNFGLYRTDAVLQYSGETADSFSPSDMDDTWYFLAQTPAIDNQETSTRRNYKVKWSLSSHDGEFGPTENFYLLDYDWEFLGFSRSDTAIASFIFDNTIPLFYLIRGNTAIGEARRNEILRVVANDGSDLVLYREKHLNLLQIRQILLLGTGTTIDQMTFADEYMTYFGFDPDDFEYFTHDS